MRQVDDVLELVFVRYHELRRNVLQHYLCLYWPDKYVQLLLCERAQEQVLVLDRETQRYHRRKRALIKLGYHQLLRFVHHRAQCQSQWEAGLVHRYAEYRYYRQGI